MLNKMVVVGLVLIVGHVHAETIYNLKEQNEKLLSLRAQLEIEKTKSELEKTKFESLAIASANLPKPHKPVTIAELDGVDMVSVSGDIHAPIASFMVAGGFVSKRPGELLHGWTLQKLTATEAVFSKLVQVKRGKKIVDEKINRSIYLSMISRQSLSPVKAAATSMLPVTVPAVAPDLRQVK